MSALVNAVAYMDQGVSVFDADLRIVAFNRRACELLDIPESVCPPGTPLETLFRRNAARGEYGPGDAQEQVRARLELARRFEPHHFERERPNGTVLEVRGMPIPGGGFVTLYADVTERVRSERALRESEERYDAAMRAINEGVYDYDVASDAIYYSERVYDVLDAARDSLRTASDWRRLIHPDDLPGYVAAYLAHVRGETERFAFDYRYRARDGSWRWARQRGMAIRDAKGRAARVVGSVGDITELKVIEQALRESEARFRSLTELSADYYWETDAEHRITRFVHGAKMHTVVPVSGVLGHRRWELPSVHPDEEGWRAHRAVLDARLRFHDFEHARAGADGNVRHFALSGEPVFDASGAFAGYRGVGREITEQKTAEARLDRMAYFDSLTGLPNRAQVHDRLREAMARADRAQTLLGVMFLDLDRFKEINDSLGHAAGDEVLKEAARRLRACLRSTDTVGRLGGDEFAALLEDIRHVDEVSAVARKIIEAFAEPAEAAGRELRLSTSIGVTIYPLDDLDPESLLKNADIAMYQAKREGRNNFQLYAADMGSRAERRAGLRQRLHRALERGEFALHYQPQVGCADGVIFGVEALLRWNDAQLGAVSPGQFIPVAEETGLIVPLGEWVLREACRQCRQWLDAGLAPLRMAVNLSPRQFRQKDLARRVGAILAETGLPAACLEIEITEGIVMRHAEKAVATLAALNELGTRIAIDDFGTGYSSLAYLQRFPVHALKIDQTFVQAIRGGADNAPIVNAVIHLAKLLDLKTVAEGVETAEQRDYLRARGCDAFQGYLFCRPQPAGQIGEFLAAHRRERAYFASGTLTAAPGSET